jgi:hypothetical protein
MAENLSAELDQTTPSPEALRPRRHGNLHLSAAPSMARDRLPDIVPVLFVFRT